MTFLYTHYTYSLILLVSLGGLVVLDWRWKLLGGRGKSERQALRATLLCMVSFFLAWDIIGIILGIFFTNPRYTLGVNILTPNLPIEEVGFLILLVYSALLANKGYQYLIQRNPAKKAKQK